MKILFLFHFPLLLVLVAGMFWKDDVSKSCFFAISRAKGMP
jgi:hypothetical protein